ncbi:MAG: hypothetical protein GC204_19570 [Chloroflexi bacterium]|nr:hypothetical protein [Chloroflexota bacterium]
MTSSRVRNLSGTLLALILLLALIAGCQSARSTYPGTHGARTSIPSITPNVVASLMIVQQTQNAARATQTQIAALTPEADAVKIYCETSARGTLTPDQCERWASRILEVYPTDVAYCQHTPDVDFGACLTDRNVPLPE